MCYSDSLNGIILSYDNINVIGNTSNIIDDSPFIGIDIEVDFLVIRFKKHDVIKGVITKFSRNKIDLLIYNTFNAQINVSSELMNNDNFRHSYLHVGQQITFQNAGQHITLGNRNKMIQITGKLPKHSNIGIFDGNQNFVSIIDVLKGSARNDINREVEVPVPSAKPAEVVPAETVELRVPQEPLVQPAQIKSDDEDIEMLETPEKKKSKKKNKKSKKKSKKQVELVVPEEPDSPAQIKSEDEDEDGDIEIVETPEKKKSRKKDKKSKKKSKKDKKKKKKKRKHMDGDDKSQKRKSKRRK
eukprot:61423_1